MRYSGRIHRFGNNINTDLHLSSKYQLPGTTLQDVTQKAFTSLDPKFIERVAVGDFIVAGENFGANSSREDAILVIKNLGIKAVIAPSFGNLFFRNAINLGLIVIPCQVPVDVQTGEYVAIDLNLGILETKDKKVSFTPLPSFIKDLIECDGLIGYIKKSEINKT